jgi:hypothetical protein
MKGAIERHRDAVELETANLALLGVEGLWSTRSSLHEGGGTV